MTVVRGFVGWTRFDLRSPYGQAGIAEALTAKLMEGIAVNSTAEVCGRGGGQRNGLLWKKCAS
jgi:hypothetical protein